MAYLIGLALALAVSVYGTTLRMDRDGAFYAFMLVVVGSYYVLFAAMGGSGRVIVIESIIAGVFVVAASLGFRKSMWLVAVGLAAHGVMDFFFHGRLVANPGMPAWWPAFCGAYDVAAAGYLAWRLTRNVGQIAPRQRTARAKLAF